MVSDISETLREEHGHREVADEQDGHDQTNEVLRGHNRSTPLTMRAVSAKNAMVRTTNTRSAMLGLLSFMRSGATTREVLTPATARSPALTTS